MIHPSNWWTIRAIQDSIFKKNILGRQLKFALFPRQCHITKRLIWLEFAYCVTAMYRPDFSIYKTDSIYVGYEHRWYSKDEYLIARLKDLI
jgi:hypothetical protein